MQKIWICGANGQLGQALNSVIDHLKYEIFNTDVDELDVRNINDVMHFGEINRPDIIVNCCGLTDISLCEKNPSEAFHINAIGARNLSITAQKTHAKIVQISSDDVFDGHSTTPYTEYDVLNPVTVYGKSKAAAENYVREFTSRHFIIRSTWVYGKGNNFVNNVINMINSNQPLHVAGNSTGSPTSALELARFILALVETNEYGTFHATNKGTCSRYEFACEIARLLGKDADIRMVNTEDSDFSSARPEYAVLNNFVLDMLKVYSFPTWQESLCEYMKTAK